MKELTATVKGGPILTPDGSTPTDETLPDGQKADHWVLPEADRKAGYVRPVRREYKHVGVKPKNPLRDLTDEEKERYKSYGYVKFEAYPHDPGSAITGRFWTEKQLQSGCGTVTTMPLACAETYAKKPDAYGSTFCCGCGEYLPVGERGEFVWLDDGTRVGT